MKKNFKLYLLGWLILLGLFNLLTFILPAWPTLEKFTALFWIAWGVAIASFVGQLICSWISFKDDNAKKTFYGMKSEVPESMYNNSKVKEILSK